LRFEKMDNGQIAPVAFVPSQDIEYWILVADRADEATFKDVEI
jgi:hypothetical protein